MSNEITYTPESIKNILDSHRDVLKNKYNAVNFWLFGSYARGEQSAKSDIDLLVEFDTPIDMFRFLDLEENLEYILGKKVDLGTLDSLKPFIKDSILAEAIIL